MTNYENIMQNMTVEDMAIQRVKLIVVNQSDLFYITSRGQLYNFNKLQEAVQDEYNWLTTTISTLITEDTTSSKNSNEAEN